jgi:hypothetical protein
MTKRGKFYMAMSFGLAASLTAVWPAKAQTDIEEQIRSLEADVRKSNDQIERLRWQQMELKKEATAAAQEMPTFSYRPGRGLTVSGADKSWSFNMSARFNIYNYNILGAKSNYNDNGVQRNTGSTAFELYPRRARVYTTFCWANCFYSYEHSIDGETADRDASFRDNEFLVNFTQLNPWLPYFSVGLRRGAGRTHISRSSDNDGKVEHSIILDGFDWGGDGSHAGMGLGWDGVDIGPGEYELYLNFASSQQGTWQEFLPSDRKGFLGFIGGKPFSKTKNKWISGLDVGVGYQGESQDRPENFDPFESGNRVRVRNGERKSRQTFWEPAPLSAGGSEQNVGSGWSSVWIPGMKWAVGPYFFRFVYVNTRFANINPGIGSGISGSGWTIDHQVKLWSPKGFFTGSQTTPNSLIFSFGFERADMNCGRACDASPSTGSFHRNHITEMESALWYWFQPSLGFGVWWQRWTSSNTPYRTQVATGCKDSRAEALAGDGVSRSCTFNSFNTGLRYRW